MALTSERRAEILEEERLRASVSRKGERSMSFIAWMLFGIPLAIWFAAKGLYTVAAFPMRSFGRSSTDAKLALAVVIVALFAARAMRIL